MVASLQMIPPSRFAEKLTPIRWLWDGVVATGMITLLTSRWKAGKTTLISALLARLGTGGNLAGSAVPRSRVGILSEEPVSLWNERHLRLGFDEDHTRFSCRPFHRRPTPDQWSESILELADAAYGLVVIDPLAKFLPGNIENQPGALLDALEELHVLTDSGTAVLLSHHPSKRGSGRELSPRGCGALTGFADILVDLDYPSGVLSDRVRRLKIASRLAGSTERYLELSPGGDDYNLWKVEPNPESFEIGWPVLKAMLEDASSPPTRKAILAHWLEDFEKPSKNTLIRWLERAEAEGLIERGGSGRQHDAFRYRLKGQEDNPAPPNPFEVLEAAMRAMRNKKPEAEG